tara:strand:- start:33254 stop:34057 length:804 start_codon:yes stop_codon:yes gene_type:complete
MACNEMYRTRHRIFSSPYLALVVALVLIAPTANAAARDTIWGDLLKTYVSTPSDGINRFDYRNVSPSDHEKLTTYLENMQRLDPGKMGDAEQRTYWINLYNALTVKVVLEHFPVESIRNIRSGLFSIGPWDKKIARVDGEYLSLNNIEQDILRTRWNDNRIHYALNCASLGCPNLQPEPFSAEKLDEQLDEAAQAYVNHPRGATIHNGKLTISSIYKWYAEDFGNSDALVIKHIASFATPVKASQLKNISKIDTYEYDWTLNAPDSN